MKSLRDLRAHLGKFPDDRRFRVKETPLNCSSFSISLGYKSVQLCVYRETRAELSYTKHMQMAIFLLKRIVVNAGIRKGQNLDFALNCILIEFHSLASRCKCNAERDSECRDVKLSKNTGAHYRVLSATA